MPGEEVRQRLQRRRRIEVGDSQRGCWQQGAELADAVAQVGEPELAGEAGTVDMQRMQTVSGGRRPGRAPFQLDHADLAQRLEHRQQTPFGPDDVNLGHADDHATSPATSAAAAAAARRTGGCR